MNIMNLFDTEGFVPGNQREHYKSHYKDMAEKFGAQKLGFYIKVLTPKCFSVPYHWHTGEEELVLVIEGEATVRCNNEFKVIKPGDLVFYGTGPETVHHMYNHTDKPFKYFTLSNQAPDVDKCFYPDSNKESSEHGYMQNGVAVDYFKDEEDPRKNWPQDRL